MGTGKARRSCLLGMVGRILFGGEPLITMTSGARVNSGSMVNEVRRCVPRGMAGCSLALEWPMVKMLPLMANGPGKAALYTSTVEAGERRFATATGEKYAVERTSRYSQPLIETDDGRGGRVPDRWLQSVRLVLDERPNTVSGDFESFGIVGFHRRHHISLITAGFARSTPCRRLLSPLSWRRGWRGNDHTFRTAACRSTGATWGRKIGWGERCKRHRGVWVICWTSRVLGSTYMHS